MPYSSLIPVVTKMRCRCKTFTLNKIKKMKIMVTQIISPLEFCVAMRNQLRRWELKLKST